MLRPFIWAIVLLAVAFIASAPASACSVCQGDPNSNMVKAAQGGVVVMVLVTYGVLMIFGTMIAVCFVRYRRLVRSGTGTTPTPRSSAEQVDE